MFSERIHGFGLRNVLALVALLASAALIFTHSAGADDPAFQPTVSFETSTHRAAAHPDLRITIDNSGSTEQIKKVSIAMPDGMMGSLNAAEQCPRAVAVAKDCDTWNSGAAKIGTVTNEATIVDAGASADVKLSGGVYLTEALDDGGPSGPTSTNPRYADPAGLQIVVPAKISGVDMGKVVVNARVQLRYGDVDPGQPSGTVGAIRGVDTTTIDDVPKQITDSHGRTVTFTLKKLVVDLKSDQDSPHSKLLTNASYCSTTQFKIDFDGWNSSTKSLSEDYTVGQCDDVHVADIESSTFTPLMPTGVTGPVAGSEFGIDSTIEFADDQPAAEAVRMQMPPGIAAYAPGYGAPSDQCPPQNASGDANGISSFTKEDCPSSAKAGKVEIDTPLLPHTLYGDLYFMDGSPIPALGIWVDPTTDDDQPVADQHNPAGVEFGVGGYPSTSKVVECEDDALYAKQPCTPPDDPPGLPSMLTCSTTGMSGLLANCKTAITVDFVGLPDVPLKKIRVRTFNTTRRNAADNGDLAGQFLSFASAGDPNCQPNDDVAVLFSSWTGATWDPDNFAYKTTKRGVGVAPYSITGCNARASTMTSSPYGTVTSSTGPVLDFTSAQATAKCGLDTQKFADMATCDPVAGTGTFTPAAPGIAPGLHHFFTVAPGTSSGSPASKLNWRTFGVKNPSPSDTTAPEVTLSDEPSNPTSNTTPSVDFEADEDAYFRCAFDDGPYLPCSSTATPVTANTTNTYTVSSPVIPSDETHKIRVRAQDQAGNVSSVEQANFKVEVPLDPTFDVFKPDTTDPGISTTEARAHPEFDIKVTSGSHEDIEDLTLAMPDGLLGSLNAVPTICPIETAKAGNCTAASQIGTVTTEAVVDQSTMRLPGKVYLTSPIVPGDPAGIVVDVPAKIQDVDDGHVVVPVRLKVRGPAIGNSNSVSNIEGIDSVATELPTGIDPALWGNTWDGPSEFDLREMTIKLRNNPSGSQPLMTNPSRCTPDDFAVSFKGYDGTTVAKDTADLVWTGCESLPFNAGMSMSLIDPSTGTYPRESTAAHLTSATLTSDLSLDANGSSVASASVLLPKNVTINVAYLPAPCPVATYQAGGADACPESTVVGSVSATSPLLREPINGKVYILKSDSSLPRLLLALRGPINTDVIGEMLFENVWQIRTTFSTVPDTPISSLHLVVNKIVSTRNEACSYTPAETNVVSTFTAINGKAATAINSLPVTCDGTGEGVKYSYKKTKKKKGKRQYRSTVAMTLRAPTGTEYKSIQVEFPKGIKMIKKGFKKGLSIKAGTKKVKYRCGRAKKSNLFTTTLCGKPSQFTSLSFRAGTINGKRVKKPVIFKITAVDNLGRTQTFDVEAKTNYSTKKHKKSRHKRHYRR